MNEPAMESPSSSSMSASGSSSAYPNSRSRDSFSGWPTVPTPSQSSFSPGAYVIPSPSSTQHINCRADVTPVLVDTTPKLSAPRSLAVTPRREKSSSNVSHSTSSSYSSFSSPPDSDSSPKYMVNYSPKHSRKPSSLTSNRNINMKNLSLNLDDGSSITAGPTSGASKKALSIGISASDQPSDSQSPFLSSSPIVHNNSSTMLLDSKTSSSLKLSPVESSPRVRNNPALHTSKDYKFPHSDLTESFSKLAVSQSETHTLSFRPNVPEELQESSQLDAYPNGPANVLNGSVFLYSEPTIDEINQFDLVINVAKECPDLSAEFNKENLASKKYIYIPWNHTSSISEELPQLTRLMASYDDSDSRSRKRKILVHCQCGVSRSACVVVAYFMMKFKMNVNDAYELLKTGTSASSPEKTNRQVFERGYTIQSCDRICPNMSLIFELMDFNETLNHVH